MYLFVFMALLNLQDFVYSIKMSTNTDFVGTFVNTNGHDYYVLKPENLDSGDRLTCLAFIHGFPDTVMTWYGQMGHFKKMGYHSFSFGLKGYYSPSADPAEETVDPSQFDVTSIAADYLKLMTSFDESCTDWHVVGHDWGAIIGRVMLPLAEKSTVRVASFTSVAIPDLTNFLTTAVFNAPVQVLNSWYFFFFQLPFWPEQWLLRSGIRNTIKSWTSVQSVAHQRHVYRALAHSSAITSSAVHYYRRNIIPLSGIVASDLMKLVRDPVSQYVPTLYVAGMNDNCISNKMFVSSPSVNIEFIGDSGHYPHLEQPETFNSILVKHIGITSRSMYLEEP